jgi:hypothetical protein
MHLATLEKAAQRHLGARNAWTLTAALAIASTVASAFGVPKAEACEGLISLFLAPVCKVALPGGKTNVVFEYDAVIDKDQNCKIEPATMSNVAQSTISLVAPNFVILGDQVNPPPPPRYVCGFEVENLQSPVTLTLGQESASVTVSDLLFPQCNTAQSYTDTYGNNCLAAPPGPLPIELSKFEAKKTTSSCVRWDWRTESESNNAGFVLEQSLDGKLFSKIQGLQQIESKAQNGSSGTPLDYSKEHCNSSWANTIYFRLKQLDFDQTFSYSKVASVEFDAAATTLVSPNPVRIRNPARLMITGASVTQEIEIRLVGQSGKVVWSTKIEEPANGAAEVELPTGFAAGIYQVVFITRGRKLPPTKLVIQ